MGNEFRQSGSRTIILRLEVKDNRITLPPGWHFPDGTDVEVNLIGVAQSDSQSQVLPTSCDQGTREENNSCPQT
jgi:hypothetical protein